MQLRSLVLVFALLAPAACAPGGPPSPPALAWDVPEPSSLTYLRGDTATMDLELGGQRFQVRVRNDATLEMDFARAEDGVRVSASVVELSGRFSQPMGAPVTADASGIEGPLAFTLGRRGEVSEVASPEIDDAVAQVMEPLAVAHSLFPRLPGTAAAPGESWTDTIRFEGETRGGEVRTLSVLTYTLEGDTAVAGRSLLRIRSRGTMDASSSGRTAGMRVSQSARGDVEGSYLFDPARRVLVHAHEEADLRGSMEVSAAPGPMDLRVRQRTTLRLDEGG